MEYREILKASYTLEERKFTVFGSKKDLIAAGFDELLPARVNWSRELVIGLFAGCKPGGGYRIAVSKLEAEDRQLNVYFVELPPKPGMLISQAQTYPGQLIAIRRNALARGDWQVAFITEGKVMATMSFVN